ncbi:hypothetical protein J5N97_002179 [Dioscorea zingiberensis]|uniref:Uncharacterized protein n=1 Tax=Dioscorea zingiberensis TaxID=325984 RepID=A0A9D5HP79_9LILI|nr:hypothetical protein J5N97_002179 [Dioscorea zingiberensis]
MRPIRRRELRWQPGGRTPRSDLSRWRLQPARLRRPRPSRNYVLLFPLLHLSSSNSRSAGDSPNLKEKVSSHLQLSGESIPYWT